MKHIFILVLIAITGAIAYALFIFMSPSLFMQKVNNNITITNEWLSITPLKPLDIRYRNQELSLRVENVHDWELDDENKPTGFIDPDGQRYIIEAELIDSNGTKYYANILGISRGLTLSIGSKLNKNVKIEKVRMHSSHPLKILSTFWVCYSSK